MTELNEQQIAEKVEILKAMAHPTRLQILEKLHESPQCVGSIEEVLPASQVNISQHLTILRHARLVGYVQEGALRCYYLAQPELVGELLDALATEREPVTRTKDDVRREREAKGTCPQDH